jgi:hypothetical protein
VIIISSEVERGSGPRERNVCLGRCRILPSRLQIGAWLEELLLEGIGQRRGSKRSLIGARIKKHGLWSPDVLTVRQALNSTIGTFSIVGDRLTRCA